MRTIRARGAVKKQIDVIKRPESVGILPIVLRELRTLYSHFYLILLVLVAPLMYPFIYGTVYVNKMEHDAPITVVDLDNSEASRNLIRDLDAHELIAVTEVCRDINIARRSLNSLKTSAIVIIPSGFEAELKKKKQTRISISVSNLRFMVSGDINKALGDVLSARSKNVTIAALESAGFSEEQAIAQAEPIRPFVINCFNVTESYGDFIIIGLLIIILQQTLLMGMSVSMSLERENNSLKTLFGLAQNSVGKIIAGKSIFYFVLYAAHAFLYFTLYCWIYHIPMSGSVSAAGILTLMHLVSIIVWSLLISSFFKTRLMSLCTFVFTSYPLFLLSGFSWPLTLLPRYLFYFSQCLPPTPFINAFCTITQKNGSWGDVLPQTLHMAVLLSIGFAGLWLRLALMRRTIALSENQK